MPVFTRSATHELLSCRALVFPSSPSGLRCRSGDQLGQSAVRRWRDWAPFPPAAHLMHYFRFNTDCVEISGHIRKILELLAFGRM